ncbi:MAG: hypothetical protein Q7S21_05885 [archaeon]|nr:hypothetical protein [archaeon]
MENIKKNKNKVLLRRFFVIEIMQNNEFDKFILEIQKEKMKELWDNEKDKE